MVEKVSEHVENKKDKIICSVCGREISLKEHYVQDIITGEITCEVCEDNRLLLKGENFFSIE